jgi:hypothetical protein
MANQPLHKKQIDAIEQACAELQTLPDRLMAPQAYRLGDICQQLWELVGLVEREDRLNQLPLGRPLPPEVSSS